MNPKHRLGIIALGLSAVLITVTLLRSKSPEVPALTAPPEGLASAKPAPTTLRMLVSKPLVAGNSALGATSLECASFESMILGLSVDDFEYPPRIAKLPNPRGCSPADPLAAKFLTHYAEKCAAGIQSLPGSDIPEEKWRESMGECQLATLIARSTLAVLARGKKPVGEVEDLRELADRLVMSFGRLFTGMAANGMGEMREIADRMVEIDPSLIPAHKAGAMAAMLDSVGAKEKDPTATTDWSSLEKRVRDIEERSPDDPDLDTLRRIAETEGMDPNRVQRDSLSRLSRKPDDWRENQVLAWANWKLGRKDESRAALRRAMELNPTEPELQENWRATQKPGSKPDDFKISMRVGLSFNELLK